MMGVWLERGFLLATVSFLPIAVLYWFAGDFYASIGMDPLFADEAGTFTMWLIPGLFFYITYDVFRRFLFSRQVFWPAFAINVLSFALSIILCYIAAIVLDFGTAGMAVVLSCLQIASFFCLLMIIKGGGYFADIPLFQSYDNFMSQICTYMYYAVPGIALLGLGILSFEVSLWCAAYLSSAELAAHIVVLSLT
jgi:MATE family multidrug resistance protein